MNVALAERSPGIITVPGLSAVELVDLMEKETGYSAGNLRYWDFYKNSVDGAGSLKVIEARGKRYEVLTWKPNNHWVSMKMVSKHFKALRADGNVGAFIAWITETKPQGKYDSISHDAAFCRGYGMHFFPEGSNHRLLLARDVHDLAYNGYETVFVAFREIPSA